MVLHVVAPADYGGLERVVSALVRGLQARGRPTHVLAIVDRGRVAHPFVLELRAAGVPTTCVEVPPRAYLRERTHLRHVARETRAQLVHLHGARVDVVDGPVARGLGLATVSTLHGFTGGGRKNRLYEWLQVRAVRRFDAIVAVSRQMAERLRGVGVPPDRLWTLANAWFPGPQLLDRSEARAALGVPETGYRIGWVGRLTPEKGADTLIAALSLVMDLPVTVSIVGTGRLQGALEAEARVRGLAPRVTWHGFVADAARYMRAFDVFVMSSRTEGTPIALFEAIAAGVPVVATAVGGIPDVVTKQEALLAPPDDPAALAAVVRDTYANRTAAVSRARAAAARVTERFGPDEWLDAYEHIYCAAMHRASSEGGD